MLEGCGIACQLRGDILRHQWSKLMLNVGVNQATAVYGTDYSGVQAPGPARQAMLAAMEEARAVAAAQGVSLTERDVEGWLELLATFDPRGMPSMRQDVLARRPTEVELFAGTITRLGRETGGPTPVNDRFLQEIRAMEAGWSRGKGPARARFGPGLGRSGKKVFSAALPAAENTFLHGCCRAAQAGNPRSGRYSTPFSVMTRSTGTSSGPQGRLGNTARSGQNTAVEPRTRVRNRS